MSPTQYQIGRVRTALVFHVGGRSQAVVATLGARVVSWEGRGRLMVRGPVSFSPDTLGHLMNVVLPIVDQITARLTCRRQPEAFELSVVNLAATAAKDIGMSISGFSADGAALLAMLSASLGLLVPQDVAITAHLASPEGDVQWVAQLPAKLEAALRDSSIRTFVCPSSAIDSSLRIMAPGEREDAEVAVAEARRRLRIIRISDIAALLEATCTEEALVVAAFSSGYFDADSDRLFSGSQELAGPMERAVRFFAQAGRERFERVLEECLLKGFADRLHVLMTARLEYQVEQKKYPIGFGASLLALVSSIPPALRRRQGLFPLLSNDQCLKLCQLAREVDYADMRSFMVAVEGAAIPSSRDDVGTTRQPIAGQPHQVVKAIMEEISPQSLARNVGLPIDAARGSFTITNVVVSSKEEFYDAIAAFYLWIQRRVGSEEAASDDQILRAESHSLLERAFANQGGADAALAEARNGTGGAMRHVLDVMTERLKAEQQMKYMNRIVKEALDPQDWDEQVRFVAALMEYLKPVLPAEIRDQPPEQYVQQYDKLLHWYVQSVDQVRRLLTSS